MRMTQHINMSVIEALITITLGGIYFYNDNATLLYQTLINLKEFYSIKSKFFFYATKFSSEDFLWKVEIFVQCKVKKVNANTTRFSMEKLFMLQLEQ